MNERKGFYTSMYYCGYVNGKYYAFETIDAYNEYMDELDKERGETND